MPDWAAQLPTLGAADGGAVIAGTTTLAPGETVPLPTTVGSGVTGSVAPASGDTSSPTTTAASTPTTTPTTTTTGG